MPILQKRATRGIVWIILTGFLYLVIKDYYFGAVLMHNPASLASKRQLIFWVWLAFASAAWLYVLWLAVSGRVPAVIAKGFPALRERTPVLLRGLIALALLLFPTYLYLYSPVGHYALHYWARLGTLLICAAGAAAVFFTSRPLSRWIAAFTGAALLAGVCFTAAGWLNKVTAYPFALMWSEGNRLWDYSMLFGRARYIIPGDAQVFTFISAGRQFLWALPFLIPGVGIWGVRLWDALLWILPAALLGWLAVSGKPAVKGAWVWKATFALWAFIFLAQGPIYAPLIVAGILAVLAVKSRSLLLGLVLVALGGYYANISRFTWTYAPGLWAGMLALLDVECPSLRLKDWKKLVKPVSLGVAGYIGGQFGQLIVRFVSNGFSHAGRVRAVVDISSSVGRQPLLWDRLFPNTTYSPGILLGALWAGLPVVVLLVWLAWRRYWRPNWMQSLAVAVISLAFLAAGIVASVKIGGGSNLHNIDMFWVTLVLAAAWALKDLFERGTAVLFTRPALLVLVSLALLAPITYNARYGSPLSLPSQHITQTSLEHLQRLVQDGAKQGEVLMIDQRQLLTFGYLPGVPLVADYEKKYMMDQAMADNEKYFKNFEQDLANHRFAMIVTEPTLDNMNDDGTHSFAEENNAWVTYVSRPLLKYYDRKLSLDVGVQIFVPKK